MSHYALSWYALPPIATSVFGLVAGLFVLRRERSSRVGWALMPLVLVIVVLFGAHAGTYMSSDPRTAMIWARVVVTVTAFLPTSIYLYISVAVRTYRRRKKVLWGLIALSSIFVGFAHWGNLLVVGVTQHWWGYNVRYGDIGGLFIGFIIGVALVGSTELVTQLRARPPGSSFSGRILLSLLAIGVLSTAAVDFVAGMGPGLYGGKAT